MQIIDRRSTRGVLLVVFGLVCFAGTSSANESQETLLIPLPKNLPKGFAAKIAADAFQGRQWTVVSASRDEVTGEIDHRGISATLRLTILDDRITYSCERTDTGAAPRQGSGHGPAARNQPTPSVTGPCTGSRLQRWIRNIASDSEQMLVLAGLEESSDDDADRAPLAERLSILDELRSQGLVSQQEYDAKRAQILSEF